MVWHLTNPGNWASIWSAKCVFSDRKKKCILCKLNWCGIWLYQFLIIAYLFTLQTKNRSEPAKYRFSVALVEVYFMLATHQIVTTIVKFTYDRYIIVQRRKLIRFSLIVEQLYFSWYTIHTVVHNPRENFLLSYFSWYAQLRIILVRTFFYPTLAAHNPCERRIYTRTRVVPLNRRIRHVD